MVSMGEFTVSMEILTVSNKLGGIIGWLDRINETWRF